MDTATALLSIAFVAVIAFLAWSLGGTWRRVRHARAPLPFFAMLARQGVTPEAAERQAGIRVLARAVRTCSVCGRSACTERPLEACPNVSLLERLERTPK